MSGAVEKVDNGLLPIERGAAHAAYFGVALYLIATLLNAFSVFILDHWDSTFGQAGTFWFSQDIFLILTPIAAFIYAVGSVVIRGAILRFSGSRTYYLSAVAAAVSLFVSYVIGELHLPQPVGLTTLIVVVVALGVLCPEVRIRKEMGEARAR